MGYQCLECFQGTYKSFYYTAAKYPRMDARPTRRAVDPFWLGEFHDTPRFHWIVPISDAQVREHFDRPDLIVDLDAEQSATFMSFVKQRFLQYQTNLSEVEDPTHDFYILGLMAEDHLSVLTMFL